MGNPPIPARLVRNLKKLPIDEALLRELGRCGSCGGKGVYLNRGFKRDLASIRPGATRGEAVLVKGKFYNEELPCKKCRATGLDLRVWEILFHHGREVRPLGE